MSLKNIKDRIVALDKKISKTTVNTNDGSTSKIQKLNPDFYGTMYTDNDIDRLVEERNRLDCLYDTVPDLIDSNLKLARDKNGLRIYSDIAKGSPLLYTYDKPLYKHIVINSTAIVNFEFTLYPTYIVSYRTLNPTTLEVIDEGETQYTNHLDFIIGLNIIKGTIKGPNVLYSDYYNGTTFSYIADIKSQMNINNLIDPKSVLFNRYPEDNLFAIPKNIDNTKLPDFNTHNERIIDAHIVANNTLKVLTKTTDIYKYTFTFNEDGTIDSHKASIKSSNGDDFRSLSFDYKPELTIVASKYSITGRKIMLVSETGVTIDNMYIEAKESERGFLSNVFNVSSFAYVVGRRVYIIKSDFRKLYKIDEFEIPEELGPIKGAYICKENSMLVLSTGTGSNCYVVRYKITGNSINYVGKTNATVSGELKFVQKSGRYADLLVISNSGVGAVRIKATDVVYFDISKLSSGSPILNTLVINKNTLNCILDDKIISVGFDLNAMIQMQDTSMIIKSYSHKNLALSRGVYLTGDGKIETREENRAKLAQINTLLDTLVDNPDDSSCLKSVGSVIGYNNIILPPIGYDGYATLHKNRKVNDYSSLGEYITVTSQPDAYNQFNAITNSIDQVKYNGSYLVITCSTNIYPYKCTYRDDSLDMDLSKVETDIRKNGDGLNKLYNWGSASKMITLDQLGASFIEINLNERTSSVLEIPVPSIKSYAVYEGSKFLAVLSKENTIFLFDGNKLKKRILLPTDFSMNYIQFYNSDSLVMCSKAGTIYIYNFQTETFVKSYSILGTSGIVDLEYVEDNLIIFSQFGGDIGYIYEDKMYVTMRNNSNCLYRLINLGRKRFACNCANKYSMMFDIRV